MDVIESLIAYPLGFVMELSYQLLGNYGLAMPLP